MKALLIVPTSEGYAFIETPPPETVTITDFIGWVDNSYSYKISEFVADWVRAQKDKVIPSTETP